MTYSEIKLKYIICRNKYDVHRRYFDCNGSYISQYYEMSYGLNVEKHKHVSRQDLN